MSNLISKLTPEQRWLLAVVCSAGSAGMLIDTLEPEQLPLIKYLEELRLVERMPSWQMWRRRFTTLGADVLGEPITDTVAYPVGKHGPPPFRYFAVAIGEGTVGEMIGVGTSAKDAWEAALDAAMFTSTLTKEALHAEMLDQGYRTVPIDAAPHARAYAGDWYLAERAAPTLA